MSDNDIIPKGWAMEASLCPEYTEWIISHEAWETIDGLTDTAKTRSEGIKRMKEIEATHVYFLEAK